MSLGGLRYDASAGAALAAPPLPPPPAPWRQRYVRPALLGMIDGLITSFAIVAGGLASGAATRAVLLIGWSSLLADGLSMGASEALSSRAQHGGGLPWRTAAARGGVCFAGFVTSGAAPLLGYTLGPDGLGSALLFLAGLVAVGAGRAWASDEPRLRAVVEVTAVGAAAGAVAYGVASVRL